MVAKCSIYFHIVNTLLMSQNIFNTKRKVKLELLIMESQNLVAYSFDDWLFDFRNDLLRFLFCTFFMRFR